MKKGLILLVVCMMISSLAVGCTNTNNESDKTPENTMPEDTTDNNDNM